MAEKESLYEVTVAGNKASPRFLWRVQLCCEDHQKYTPDRSAREVAKAAAIEEWSSRGPDTLDYANAVRVFSNPTNIGDPQYTSPCGCRACYFGPSRQ